MVAAVEKPDEIEEIEPKPLPSNFKYDKKPRITPEIIDKVAQDVGLGLPLELALSLLDRPVTRQAFEYRISKPSLFARYTRKIAWQVKCDIETIRLGDSKECRRFPGLSFLLERRHREYFGKQPETMNQTNIQINGAPSDFMGVLRDVARKKKLKDITVEAKEIKQ